MATLAVTPQDVRRLAVVSQRLEAPRPNPSKADLFDTIRQITCLQIDPINVVARTQLLVPFSRLGRYDTANLNVLLWEDRALFEYWAHAASIVLADDFALFRPRMQEHKPGGGVWGERYQRWIDDNNGFRQRIRDELATRGPLYADEIESTADAPGAYGNTWSSGNDLINMLDLMWMRGDITVTQRQGEGYGLKKRWGLLEYQLGQQVHEPPEERPLLVRRAVERALPALGIATQRHIKNYFTRNLYPGLAQALAQLEKEGVIQRVVVVDDSGEWPGKWYIHNDSLADLERVRRGDWRPQTVLLSPFDNLIADRDRAEQLFDFFYRIEIYTTPAKRQYGYYVMPVLRGDRLIGRVDPKMDRKANRLIVNAVHWEPGVVVDEEARAAVTEAIESLAAFLGADVVEFLSQDT